MTDIDYEKEMELADQVAKAVECLFNFIDQLECCYEPLMLAIFRIQYGMVVENTATNKTEIKGGLSDAIDDLSEVIAKLQLELRMK